MKKLILSLSVWISVMASGQWSDNPGQSTIIHKGPDIRDVEVINNDGCYYVSWVQRPYGGPDLRMVQRLDHQGCPVWRDSSRMRSINGSLDYSSSNSIRNIFSDRKGNLIVSEIRFDPYSGTMAPVITATSPDGRPLWSTFRELTRKGFHASYQQLCMSSSGIFYLAIGWSREWYHFSEMSLIRISESGIVDWQLEQVIANNPSAQFASQVQLFPDQEEGCLVIYLKSNLDPINGRVLSREIAMRNITHQGCNAWKRDVVIVRSGGSLYWGPFNSPRTDDGCLYVIWYEKLGMPVIQKMHPDGYAIWDPYGVVPTDLAAFYHPAAITGASSDGGIYVLYATTTKDSVFQYVQKLSADGERTLGSNGRLISTRPYGDLLQTFTNTLNDTTLVLSLIKDSLDKERMLITATGLDPESHPIWERNIIIPESYDRNVVLQGLTAGFDGQFVFTWLGFDSTRLGDRIMAQNIHTDGTLGNRAAFVRNASMETEWMIQYDPVSKAIKVSGAAQPLRFQICRSNGQLILGGQTAPEIILPDLPAGLYFITVTDGQHQETQGFYFSGWY